MNKGKFVVYKNVSGASQQDTFAAFSQTSKADGVKNK